jgi:hypothetical protein
MTAVKIWAGCATFSPRTVAASRLRVARRPDHVLNPCPYRVARQSGRGKCCTNRFIVAGQYTERQVLGADVLAAVAARLVMGLSDTGPRSRAEHVEHGKYATQAPRHRASVPLSVIASSHLPGQQRRYEVAAVSNVGQAQADPARSDAVAAV